MVAYSSAAMACGHQHPSKQRGGLPGMIRPRNAAASVAANTPTIAYPRGLARLSRPYTSPLTRVPVHPWEEY